MREGRLQVNPPQPVADLDAIPFPAWDLMPPGRYPSLVSKRSPAATIMTSRGCSNRCHFCAESHKRLRFRSVANVIEEIRLLVRDFGVREIQFLDSNFIVRKNYVLELCRGLEAAKLDLALCAPNGTRLEAVDDEVCAALVRVGFYRVNVGIESGSAEILREIGKGAELEMIRRKIPFFRRHGIEVIGNFMMGFPGETQAQMNQTLRLALELDLTAANFSIYVPMPGTLIYERMVREGRLPERCEFHDYNYVSYENRLSALSPRRLKRFRNHCLSRFMLRPRTLVTLFNLARSGVLWNGLFRRLYWMYLSKLLPSRRGGTPPGNPVREKGDPCAPCRT